MSTSISRRQFLRNVAETTTTAVGLPYIVPSTVLDQGGTIEPSNQKAKRMVDEQDELLL